MIVALYFTSIFMILKGKGDDQYWLEDFDETKNCQQEKLITKLQKEKDENGEPIRCASVAGISDEKER